MGESAALEIANHAIEIATLPEVTMRIIEVVQDERSTAHDLHQIVRNDPALSARVLRVVNSAFYGLPGQIGSIDRAIMLLGLNAVKNIAIAASIGKMFKSSVICDDFTGKDLWTHSVAVGATNKLIASAAGMSLPDEAFLTGLIHDIGLVAVMQCHAEDVQKIVDITKSGVPYRKAEEKIIGANHQEIGIALTTKWKFPRSFQFVTGFHHEPTELALENRMLSVITHISDILCARGEFGMTITVETEEVPQELKDEIGMTSEQLDEISGNIEDELQAVRSLIE
ncbi:MAG: HDOD domain-containing protein [Sedimentisphaerales bacterium]|nr:HDOD domain-containing protein [Sedimentisphaerales bacterium]